MRNSKYTLLLSLLAVLPVLLLSCAKRKSADQGPQQVILTGSVSLAEPSQFDALKNGVIQEESKLMIVAVDENGNTTTNIFSLDENYSLPVFPNRDITISLFELPSMAFLGKLTHSDEEIGALRLSGASEIDFSLTGSSLLTEDIEVSNGSDNFITLQNGAIDVTHNIDESVQYISLFDFFPRPYSWSIYADQPEDKDSPDRIFSLTYHPTVVDDSSFFDRITVLTEYYNGDSGFWNSVSYGGVGPPTDPPGDPGVGGFGELTISSQDFSFDIEKATITSSFYDPTGSVDIGLVFPLNPKRGERFPLSFNEGDEVFSYQFSFNRIAGFLEGLEGERSRKIPVAEMLVEPTEAPEEVLYLYLIAYYGVTFMSDSSLDLAEIRSDISSDIRMGTWFFESDSFDFVEFKPQNISQTPVVPEVNDSETVRQNWLQWLHTHRLLIRTTTLDAAD